MEQEEEEERERERMEDVFGGKASGPWTMEFLACEEQLVIVPNVAMPVLHFLAVRLKRNHVEKCMDVCVCVCIERERRRRRKKKTLRMRRDDDDDDDDDAM